MIGKRVAARLVHSAAEYDARFPAYDELFESIGHGMREHRAATKADIAALIFWKRIRTDSWAGQFLATSDQKVIATTKAAFARGLTDEERLERLRALPGFRHGAAVPSTLLAAWNPAAYGIYDRNAKRALAALALWPSDAAIGVARYFKLIRDVGNELEMTPRAVDKALFIIGRAVRK